MKLCASIITLITLIGMVFGVYFYVDSRYALAEELKKVQQRLDYKIKSDQEMSIRERIWKIEDKYGYNPKDPIIREELRGLKNDLGGVNEQIKVMEKK